MSILVVYYPQFKTQDEFSNHYHRAAWYLPKVSGGIEEVVLGVKNDFSLDNRPPYMCKPRQVPNHIKIEDNYSRYVQCVRNADLVLLWKNVTDDAQAGRLLQGKKRRVVTTDDPQAIEWGTYCSISWQLMEEWQRQELLQESHERFKSVVNTGKIRARKTSLILGNGPSIEKVFDYDLSAYNTIVCNSAIKDKKLLSHAKPRFVTAGDAVSHFGISLYAEKFREHLSIVLEYFDMYILATAKYGNLLRLQYPELGSRVLLCEQTTSKPVYNLFNYWGLPRLDSTLNVHMLPLAATLGDSILMLGFDGKRPDGKSNEDFWAHSPRTHFHDLVETGHLAHPMFNKRRQEITDRFFRESTMYSLAFGEKHFNKKYYSLSPSFTPAIDRRRIPDHMVNLDNNNGLKTLCFFDKK
ncbi:MAG: hypothetical protein K9L21_01980 [Spirochaetia bacterium]|nr:hypothetical protein [Spirochaetia bacterium]